jgi:mxaJ protein
LPALFSSVILLRAMPLAGPDLRSADLPTRDWVGGEQAIVVTPPSRERVFRVAAAANNLPYSNDRLEGFENRIVSILAEELGARVEYVWCVDRDPAADPVLQEQQADIVPGVARGHARTLTTASYYQSGYVFVQRAESVVGPLRSLDDEALRRVAVGVHHEPSANSGEAILREGFLADARNVRAYAQTHARGRAPVLEALLRGEIEVAIMPGPLAGFLAQHETTPLTITPIESPSSPAARALDTRIAMAVRPGDTGLRDELNAALSRRRAEIDAILLAYGVPRSPEADTRHARTEYDASSAPSFTFAH